MRIFKYRRFHKWSVDENLSDEALIHAVNEMEQGLFDANLGGGLYKKRIARAGKGKRSGYRVLLTFKAENRTIFIDGFAKNETENVNEKTQRSFQNLGQYYISANDVQLNHAIKIGELIEVII
jgi:hypothetical protein